MNVGKDMPKAEHHIKDLNRVGSLGWMEKSN